MCQLNFAEYLLGPDPVPEDVLEHDEEVLQGNVVRVQLPPELQAALYHLRMRTSDHVSRNQTEVVPQIDPSVKLYNHGEGPY